LRASSTEARAAPAGRGSGVGMVQENYGAVRFSVGGVIGAGVSIVLRNVLKLLAISFLMSIPITVLAGLFVATLPIGFSALQSGVRADFSELSDATKVLFALLFVGIFLTYFAIQAAVNYAAFQNLRGERVGIGACMRRGLAAMPRVVVACIMLALMMIGIGIAVSIVMILITAVISLSGPSTGGGIAIGLLYGVGFFGIFIFMFIIWWVFIPAIVVEDAGPVACFGRSRRLTKGHRWGILGILALVFLANIVAGLVVSVFARLGLPVVASVLNLIVSLFFAALSSVLAAVGYYYLRAEKEGFGIGDLAGVFD
jgi:hypothetical protein